MVAMLPIAAMLGKADTAFKAVGGSSIIFNLCVCCGGSAQDAPRREESTGEEPGVTLARWRGERLRDVAGAAVQHGRRGTTVTPFREQARRN